MNLGSGSVRKASFVLKRVTQRVYWGNLGAIVLQLHQQQLLQTALQEYVGTDVLSASGLDALSIFLHKTVDLSHVLLEKLVGAVVTRPNGRTFLT